MDGQKKNFLAKSNIGGLSQALSLQSIVDVFVVQGLILPSDGEKIKSKYQNNLAVEKFLLANKLISREAINKAYSIILKLPFISLANVEIPKEVEKIISDRVAKKYQILAFAKKNQILSIAIASPGELFLRQNQSFEKLITENKYSLELFITTPEDLTKIFNRNSRNNNDNLLLEKGSVPVVFLRNRNIDQKIFKLLPLDFVIKNRIAIFEQIGPKRFRVAEEDPYSQKTKQIISYLKNNNNLDLEEFATSKDDIDYLVSIYNKKNEDLSKDDSIDTNKSGVFGGIVESLSSNGEPGIISEESIEVENKKATDASAGLQSKPLADIQQGAEEKNNYQNQVKNEIEVNKKLEDDDKDIGKLLGKEIKTIEELKEVAKENSIPKFVAAVISFALSIGSSDIHIEPESKRLRIRCRVDGVLKDIFQLPLEYGPQVISRVKILGSMKLDESRIPQDGRFSVKFLEREVDVRVSVLPTVYGEKTVMRILDKTQGIRSLEDLGFVGSAFKIIMEEIKKPYGVIMATGPTGSGKSTTLYAVLNRLNQPGVNVVTLEDPVEYEVAGVNQCQIKPKIGFTFAEGLRSILRQDPNIIMVGEIRDADTASMSTHAALTGHLVLTTLHTNDAASALPRLINMGVEPFLITSSVNLIIAQRLLRRICPKCREKIEIPDPLKMALKTEIDKISKNNKEDLARVKELQFYKGRGCSECNGGYKGRLGIYELLVMNDQIEALAVSRRPASEIKDIAISSGMLTMRQDGILKAIDGLTTIDEVLLATGEISMGEAINIANAESKKTNLNDESK